MSKTYEISRIFEAYYDLCVSNKYPRKLFINEGWRDEFSKRYDGAWKEFLGAEVSVDFTCPDFRFEDIR